MLKSGKDYLDGLRDGRVVYIGRERVDDVTTHPAFREAARAFADFYDLKRDPAQPRCADLRGGRRAPLDLLHEGAKTREDLAAHATRIA